MEADYAQLADELAGSHVSVAKFQARRGACLCVPVWVAPAEQPAPVPVTSRCPAEGLRCAAAFQRPMRCLLTPARNRPLVTQPQADTEREFAAEKFGLATFPTLVLLPKGSKGGACGCGCGCGCSPWPWPCADALAGRP